MACHHFDIAKITKRHKKSFGTYRARKTEEGKNDPVLSGLDDPFWMADFRDFQVIQPDDAIMGPQTFWFGLHEHEYYSWEELFFYRRYQPGSNIEDAFRYLQPDIFVIDSQMDNFILYETDSKYSKNVHIPKLEVETFLAERGQILSNFNNDLFGHVRVYRLIWDN
jgi:hypothetical protein